MDESGIGSEFSLVMAELRFFTEELRADDDRMSTLQDRSDIWVYYDPERRRWFRDYGGAGYRVRDRENSVH
jgi:hypothetical protein